jgi:hypothetical protein
LCTVNTCTGTGNNKKKEFLNRETCESSYFSACSVTKQ